MRGGGLRCGVSARVDVVNSILWRNAMKETHAFTSNLRISFSNYSGIVWFGPENMHLDPMFVDGEGGDFRLRRDSRLIDSGTRTEVLSDFAGTARPVDIPGLGRDGAGDEFDMGAYEFVDAAGDLNLNGFLDPLDLFAFSGDWMKVSGASGRRNR